MAEIPTRYLVHIVDVETLAGTGAYGPQYLPVVRRAGFVDEKRQLVRAADGSEVVSEATIIMRRANLDDFTPESKVTLPSGRVSTVITAADRSDGGLGAWQHLEVALR